MTLQGTDGSGNGVGQRLGLDGTWRNIANLGAVGMLCAVLFYLVAYELPAQRREFVDEIRAIRDQTSRKADDLTTALNRLTEEVKRTRTGLEKGIP